MENTFRLPFAYQEGVPSENHSHLIQIIIVISSGILSSSALAAGSCSTEIAQDLPAHLFDELENGQYGRDYIRLLDTQLMALKA
jgi:hypothetical protein